MSLYDTFYLFYFFVITNKTTFGTFLVIAFFALNRVLFITIKHFNMKNLIFVFCLIAVCFLNASCEKCETCTTVITTSAQGIDDQVTTTTFEACGNEIGDAEGTQTATSTSGGITATAVSVTTCK